MWVCVYACVVHARALTRTHTHTFTQSYTVTRSRKHAANASAMYPEPNASNMHIHTCRCVPRIEMTYDHRHRFLLKVTFTVDKKTSFATEEELVKILLQDLILAGAVRMRVF